MTWFRLCRVSLKLQKQIRKDEKYQRKMQLCGFQKVSFVEVVLDRGTYQGSE